MPSWYPSLDASDTIKFDHIDTSGGNAGNGGDGKNSGNQTDNDTAVFKPDNYAYGAHIKADVGDTVDAYAKWDADGGDGKGFGKGGYGGDGTGGYGGKGGYGGDGGKGGDGGDSSYGGHGGKKAHDLKGGYGEGGDGGDGGHGGKGGYGGYGGYGEGGDGGKGYGTGKGGWASSNGDQYLDTGGNTAHINAPTSADQKNFAYFDQGAYQVAGIGGDGGNGNSADGGPVVFSLVHPTNFEVHNKLIEYSESDHYPDAHG
ncbi:hypothetical protein AA309_30005 [Microvirga vignae]|uniref:PE-PGRS family protein n=1 Tax=Microvirga vignae TaxID=1225564 RepID=A0A0H1R3G9_9HYPH|nr:hypothetical protein [Microvirga vignae]KLK89678.1 hypothetical protein AA309_30005 [Microvirga vignae]